MKKCTKCLTVKPLERFSKSSYCKDGRYTICKDCVNQYKRDNKERIKEKTKEYRDKNREKIKQYYIDNHDIRLEKRRAYVATHRELVYRQHRRYYEKNKDKILAYNKEYYRNNNEKAKATRKRYSDENPDKIRAIRAAYGKTDKAKQIYIRNQNTRRALKANLPATLTAQQWDEAKEAFSGHCAYCGKDKKLEQDHFIPLTSGGEYTVNNVIPSCRSCNSSKLNRDFFDWYPRQPFYSKQRERKILTYLNYKGNTQTLALF